MAGTRWLPAGRQASGMRSPRLSLRKGARVTVSGLSDQEVRDTVLRLGGNARGRAGDLTRAGEARALYDFALETGPVDFLINNVGIFEVREFFDTTMRTGSDISM